MYVDLFHLAMETNRKGLLLSFGCLTVPKMEKKEAVKIKIDSVSEFICNNIFSLPLLALLQYLTEAGWAAEGRVVGVTQPRRVACVSVSISSSICLDWLQVFVLENTLMVETLNIIDIWKMVSSTFSTNQSTVKWFLIPLRFTRSHVCQSLTCRSPSPILGDLGLAFLLLVLCLIWIKWPALRFCVDQQWGLVEVSLLLLCPSHSWVLMSYRKHV